MAPKSKATAKKKKGTKKRKKRIAQADDDDEDHMRCFDVAIVYHALLASRAVVVPTADEPSKWAAWALQKAMSDFGFEYDPRADPPSAMHAAIGIGRGKFYAKGETLRAAIDASASGAEPSHVIDLHVPPPRRRFLIEAGLVDAETGRQPTDAVASAMLDFQARVDARRALLDDDHDAKERYRAWKGSDRAADIVAGSAAALAALEAEFEDDVAIW